MSQIIDTVYKYSKIIGKVYKYSESIGKVYKYSKIILLLLYKLFHLNYR